MLFQGWKITGPLSESSFAEVRAQVDGRLERFGVADKVDEEALEVLEYRAASYPQSADAQVDLGDAHRQSRSLDTARKCCKGALALAPGHAAATAKLKEAGLERPPVTFSARHRALRG